MFNFVRGFFNSLGVVGVVAFFALLAAGFAGYLLNIYKIVLYVLENSESMKVTLLFVGRVVGLFFGPLGAVLGFF